MLSADGLLKGQVRRLPADQGERIPHMGWSPLEIKKKCPLIDQSKSLSWMYFVHSFAAEACEDDLAATTRFGTKEVTAIVWKDRLGACQFHPEKSSAAGQRMLERWLISLEAGTLPD